MFFVPLENWKSLFFVKNCRYFEILPTAILWLSLKQVFWKKSVFYVISTLTVQFQYQSFKLKLSYTLLDETFITCFMVTFFHSFILWLFHAFLYKWIFFEKLKNSVEAYLSILIDNSIFIVWWVFIKRIKLQSTFLNNDNAYVKSIGSKYSMQNKKTERTGKRKTSFPKK